MFLLVLVSRLPPANFQTPLGQIRFLLLLLLLAVALSESSLQEWRHPSHNYYYHEERPAAGRDDNVHVMQNDVLMQMLGEKGGREREREVIHYAGVTLY